MVLTEEQLTGIRRWFQQHQMHLTKQEAADLLDTIDDSGRAIRVQKRALELAMRAFLHPDKADETIREFIAMYVEQAEREEAE